MISAGPPGAPALVFGDCRLDVAAHELRRAGRLVALSARAFRLLVLLLEQRPRALSHQELEDRLWPDAHVGYTSLAQLVTEVRRAVGDSPHRQALIRTVPRHGYAFVGEVRPDPVPHRGPVGVLVGDDREYALPEGETLVGRGAECRVRLASSRVSRVHARIVAGRHEVWVEDLGSKNGTWLNGRRCDRRGILRDGDELVVGGCRMVFEHLDTDRPTRTHATHHPQSGG